MSVIIEKMEVNMQDNTDKCHVYETVVAELKEIAMSEKCDGEYLEKILKHHVISGCIYHGIPLLTVFKLVAPKSKQTEEYYKLARYLIAICDVLLSAFTVVDDILDDSETRFEKPCWHRVVGSGAAANDSHIMIASVYIMLKKHFSHLDCYTKLMEFNSKVLFVGALGQHSDEKMSREHLDNFTQENYEKMAKSKACFIYYYSFGSILILAGLTEPAIEKAQGFFFEIGFLFQILNDFLDCFEYMDCSFRSGTDIEVGKCSWLAVQCLKMASPEQKEIFYKCYGRKDPECVHKIRQMYNELNLAEVYFSFMRKSCSELKRKILQDSGDVPAEVYLTIGKNHLMWDVQYLNNNDMSNDKKINGGEL